jgi:hypothetical protein
MKRVNVKVTGIMSFVMDDDEKLEDVLTEATLAKVLKSTVLNSHDVANENLDWAVYYNKKYGKLLQMVLGSGMNISEDDGKMVNGVFVQYDRDIVGSTYDISDEFGQALIDGGKVIEDGDCDGAIYFDDKTSLEVDNGDGDHEAQWVGYKKQMGNIGHRDCLAGYLDIIGYNSDKVDDWKLIAKG